MPTFNSRTVLGVARKLTAYASLDLGLVRGPVPDPEQQLQQAQAQLQEKERQLRQTRRQLTRVREKKPKPKSRSKTPAAARQQKRQIDQQNEVPKHRRAVGGRWEEIGKLQFDFLREQGLEPEHDFLDVGCGSLRGGLHFISYLEPGNYYGIDQSQQILEAGRSELEAANLQDRQPTLVQMEDFGFERLNQTFDYALAQSVFTHLPLNLIARCLVNVDRVLRPGGTFFATYFENREGKHYLGPLEQDDGVVTYYDRDPFHYTPDAFEWACQKTGLTVERIGDWNHPRNQYILAFQKAE